MYRKGVCAVVAVAVIGFAGLSLAGPAKNGKNLESQLTTVCASDFFHPPNKALYVEADCPTGAVALGGGPLGDPGSQFDTTLLASSGPVLDSNNQQVGWNYTSIAEDSPFDGAQYLSIVVTVCVECAD
jgi:hypothetical protein